MEQILYFSKPIVLQKEMIIRCMMLGCYVMLCYVCEVIFLSCVNLKVQVMTGGIPTTCIR